MMTTQKQVRDAFWNEWVNGGTTYAERVARRRIPHRTQNDLPTDVRVAFVDFVDRLARDGEITEALAARVTL